MAIWQEPTWLQNYIAEQKAMAGTFGERYLKPLEQSAIAGISAYKSGEKSDKIKSIIDAETNAAQAEGRELDYRKLEKLLLPYDQELSMKYGALADKAEAKAEDIKVKREAIAAKAELEKKKALAKQQELTNKFDLTTEEGKLAWKNQFNKLQTATWQPGFATADEDTVKKPVLNQMESLIEQAQGYPELLASVGLKAKIKPTVTPTAEQEVTYQFKTVFDPTTGETINVPITSAVSEVKPTEVQPQEKVNHLDAIISLIDNNAKVNDKGILNSSKLGTIVDKYSQDNLQGLDKRIRDEIVLAAKNYINNRADEEKQTYSEKIASSERAKSEARSEFSQYKDYAPAINSVKSLETNPNDPTNIQMGVSQLLKIFSGTGVSDQERINFLTAMTSKQFQDKMRSETKGFTSALVKKYFIDNQQIILNDVIKNVSGEKVASELNKQIPSQAKAWFEKTQKKEQKSETKPAGTVKIQGWGK